MDGWPNGNIHWLYQKMLTDHNDVFSSCSAASDISEQKNLLAQAFEAIASSSGASKYKTGMKLPGLEKVTNESES